MNSFTITRPRYLVRGLALFLLIGLAQAQPAGNDANSQTIQGKKTTKKAKKHPRPIVGTVYKNGTIKLVWGGFPLPAAKPNETGPLVFKNIDLDEGVDPNKTTTTADIALSLNARSLAYSVSSTNGTRVVEADASDVGFDRCFELLTSSEKASTDAFRKAPTLDYCVKTTEGRVARFRILRSTPKYEGGPMNIMSVTADAVYTVWDQSR